MRATFTIDMPATCWDCPFGMAEYRTLYSRNGHITENEYACILTHKQITSTRRNRFCPLKENPAIPIKWIDHYREKCLAIEDDAIREMVQAWKDEQE